MQVKASIYREHELRISGQGDTVLGDGLVDRRGLAVPHGVQEAVYREVGEVFYCIDNERVGVFALEQHNPQGHQAVEFSVRRERVFAVDGFGHCANRQAEQ